jgi:hypothetical protein
MSQAPLHVVESTELPVEIAAVAKRIADLIGPLPATDIAIPGASWTVGEAAAHLVLANRLMAAIAAGRPSPYGDGTKAGLADANAQSLTEYTERDAAVLAEQVTLHADAFIQAARLRPGTDVVNTPMGPLPLSVLSAYMLAHMLSHGSAIASALREAPLVRPRHVQLVLPFIVATMPRLVDRATAGDLDAGYEVRVRGVSRFTVLFDDGAVTISDQPQRRVDCVISVDPVSFFLLAAGLSGQWSLIARGKLRAWGRRPWLALRFLRFFAIP